MSYDLSRPDSSIPGPIGRGLAPFGFATGTARDAATFRLRLDQWRRYVEKEAAPFALKRACAKLLTRLVQANPVGNPSLWKSPPRRGYVGGHSRRNWQVRRLPLAPELPGSGTKSAVLSKGYGDIARLPSDVRRVFLVNPVPYMERLNRGWSRQAPPGWIDAALNAVRSDLRRMR